MDDTDLRERVARVEQLLAAIEDDPRAVEALQAVVELLGVEGSVARVRLQGTCNGCPSSTATLRHAIEEAVQRAAPELEGVEAEGVAEPQSAPVLVQLGSLTC